ncbi:MAG: Rrf2 family transcriptional regulator [Bdellovibrionota bacterium]
MRITQWGEYGIHFLVHIARCTAAGEAVVGAADVACSQNVDLQYTQQILQRLRKGQIIESVRGPYGGYRLRRSANEISLYDILVAAEGGTLELLGDNKTHSCERCGGTSPCGLNSVWMGFKQSMDTYLRGCMLSDLVALPVIEKTKLADAVVPSRDSYTPEQQTAIAA